MAGSVSYVEGLDVNGSAIPRLDTDVLITSEGSVTVTVPATTTSNANGTGSIRFLWRCSHTEEGNTFVSEPIEYLALMYAHDASGPFAFSARQPSSEAFVVESGDSNSLVAGGAVNLNVLLFCGGSVSNGIGVVDMNAVSFNLGNLSNLGTAFSGTRSEHSISTEGARLKVASSLPSLGDDNGFGERNFTWNCTIDGLTSNNATSTFVVMAARPVASLTVDNQPGTSFSGGGRPDFYLTSQGLPLGSDFEFVCTAPSETHFGHDYYALQPRVVSVAMYNFRDGAASTAEDQIVDMDCLGSPALFQACQLPLTTSGALPRVSETTTPLGGPGRIHRRHFQP